MDSHADHESTSFGQAAATYERGRPPYPEAALDWLLPTGQPNVLDLGAGTGKLTRQLHARRLPVTAVDPADGMLSELRRVLPEIPAHHGSAEHIPLPDRAVDVVVVAQAWHWVDPHAAVPEIARVLAPGGRLGLVWNLRDETEDWVRSLGQIIRAPEQNRPHVIGPPFGPVETHSVPWTHRLRSETLLDLVASRSAVILMPDDERRSLLDQVRDLLRTHPALAGRDTVELPYVTFCARADLP
ncbi:class I SAM-dependent methyltransferase [Krasilnikovia sp. MM14-A1259]|uniref:class I SAM-dependent methyltransferase n=1 Tax=Krasilnikovia sp. MM14-A1259 TaxID=3373539 RepID=UPI00381331F0